MDASMTRFSMLCEAFSGAAAIYRADMTSVGISGTWEKQIS